jgi:hypothetical protein
MSDRGYIAHEVNASNKAINAGTISSRCIRLDFFFMFFIIVIV